jgi:hypothetical protein
MAGKEGGDQPAHDLRVAKNGRDVPYPQQAGFSVSNRLRAGDPILERAEHGARLGEKRRAGFGEPDSSRKALEELDAGFVLEVSDLEAQRRSGNTKPLRGAAEVAFFRRGYEIPEMSELHTSLSLCYAYDKKNVMDASREASLSFIV